VGEATSRNNGARLPSRKSADEVRHSGVGVGESPTGWKDESEVGDPSVADGVHGSSRARFVRRAAVAVGAAAAGTAVLGLRATSAASAPTAARDVRILNFLLLLEYASERFYSAAEAAGALGGELATFARVVGEHERLHLEALRTELGADARSAPDVQPGDGVRSEAAFRAAALALEEAVAAAYIGQAANLTRKRIPAVARIVAVEGRHAAWIRDVAGRLPAPSAADPPRTAAQVMKALKRAGLVIRS
jgi:hypothetical protein